jgi:hypothetical protein
MSKHSAVFPLKYNLTAFWMAVFVLSVLLLSILHCFGARWTFCIEPPTQAAENQPLAQGFTHAKLKITTSIC